MEPTNRPYVDPGTEPGDEGTEAWSANRGDDDGPLAQGGAATDDEGALSGSPADVFDDGTESLED